MSPLSARLHLRPLCESDEEALHRLWTDPQVRRFLWDGEILSREQVRTAIRLSADTFRSHRVGLWMVSLAEGNDPIGSVGFWFYHEPPQLELLLSLAPAHWGRGYAREAAAALVDFAFDALQWEWVQASADAPNTASLHLLGNLGMAYAGSVVGHFGAIEIYRIARAQWRRFATNERS